MDQRGGGMERRCIGEVVDWRGGGMERWWIGEVVEWRGGGLERWWNGEVVDWRCNVKLYLLNALNPFVSLRV